MVESIISFNVFVRGLGKSALLDCMEIFNFFFNNSESTDFSVVIIPFFDLGGKIIEVRVGVASENSDLVNN